MIAGLVGLLILTSGCQKRPATNPDEALDYVRNAVAGAEVRRLDPDPQAYMDRIFPIYMEWKAANAPIEALANVKGLWKKESNQWRQRDRIKKVLQQIKEWVADTADLKDKDAKTRKNLRQELTKQINKIPEIARSSANEFIARIRDAMDCQAHEKWLALVASDYSALFTFVDDHFADLDPKSEGLRFRSPAYQRQADALWQTVSTRLVSRAEMIVDQYQTKFDRERKNALARKKALYQQDTSNATDLREFRRLEVLIAYYEHLRREAELAARDIRHTGRLEGVSVYFSK